MKRLAKISIAIFALLSLASVAANAQHLISTKAGFVNRSEGKVFILRQDSEGGEKGRVSLGTQMRDGDRIVTEADSRVELLLSPGSYIRLNENSEIRAINTSFAQMRFELVKGSALTEISTANEQASAITKNNPVEIVTPHGTVSVAKDGLYRFDVVETNTLVQVRQGELLVGNREQFLAKNAEKIGRGKAFKLTGNANAKLEIAKVNRDAADEFDIWSFSRAQTLMAANLSALRRSRTMGALSYGWMYDPYYNCYTFIPGRGLFFSPYGFGFFNSFGNSLGYWPYGYGYGYYGGYPYNGYPSGGGAPSVPNVPARVLAGNDRAPIRREIEGRRIDSGSSFGRDTGFGSDASSRSVGSFPSSTSSSSSATSISAPAPTRSDSGGGDARAGAPTRP